MSIRSFIGRCQAVTLLLITLFTLSVSVSYQITLGQSTPPSVAVRGVAGDLWADKILGQFDFNEFMPNRVTANRVFNPGGVIVDRSVRPNRVYVMDSNSRILGYNHMGTVTSGNAGDIGKPCTSNSDYPGAICTIQEGRPADLVIGQPSLDRGACNGDGNFQNPPNRTPASASTLCTTSEFQVSTTEGGSLANMFVDNMGNLYTPDWNNHRVLLYISPFTTDTVADAVWGQADFSGNDCNRGRGFGKPDAQSFCFPSYLDDGFVAGVALDSGGNLWVTDNANNRVLRFPFNAGLGHADYVANLVLGQPNFTTSGVGIGMNQMHSPAGVRVASSGRVYVADSQQGNNGNGRVLYFDPPYTNGMSATGQLNYDFWLPTGMEFDISGGLWVSDRKENQMLLFSNPNTITKVLFKDVPNAAGVCGGPYVGDRPRVKYPGDTWQDYDLSNMCDAGGSIGVDSDGNVYAAARNWVQDVWRFPAPIPTPQVGIAHSSDARILLPYQLGEFNATTMDSLWAPNGVAVTSDQLIISDHSRILFWNNPLTVNNGQAADGYVGTSDPLRFNNPPTYGRIRQDKSGHLWAVRGGDIQVYQLPLISAEAPFKVLQSPLPVLGGGTITWGTDLYVGGLAPSGDSSWMWIADPSRNRVFRISNPLTSPLVDIILGQNSLSEVSCNQGRGQSLPSQTSLCKPGAVVLDPQGNLYVSDHALEIEGNHRLLEYDASLFPTNLASPLFAIPASRVIGANNSFTGRCDSLCGPFEPAFSSTGMMVVGVNSYIGGRYPFIYQNPLVNEKHTLLKDYGSMPYSAVFDDQDNLYIVDQNRGRALIYRTPQPDFIAPIVDVPNVVPTNNAVAVPINANITIPFSEAVTANVSSFTINCGSSQGYNLTGVNTATLVLNPLSDLPVNASCNVIGLSTGIADVAGNQLASNFTLHFTTSAVADNTSPTASLSTPSVDVDVSLDSNIVLTFSEAVNLQPAPVALECPSGAGIALTTTPAALPANGITTLTLDPTAALPAETTCTVTLAADKVIDIAGNQLGDPTEFTFTTVNASLPGQAPARNVFATATPTLTWSRISWAFSYEIQIDADTKFKLPYPTGYETPLTVTDIFVTLPTDLPDGTYYFRVRGKSATGKAGAFSPPEAFTIITH